MRTTPCVICGEPVEQDKSTSVDRQTCKRVEINGVMEKSECEKEKNRRYQENWRKNNKGKGSEVILKRQSVATTSLKHLAKYKAKKYKRNCLKCNKKFTGIGEFNRICNECFAINSKMSHLRGV
jgi:hypothetical protein